MSRDHGLAVTFAVCNSSLNRHGRASSGKRFTARFFATKNCTASRLKVRTSLLYPFAMCLLDFDPESMNYSCFLGDKSDAVMHFDLMKNNMGQ